MTVKTIRDILAYAERCTFKTADVTGGAPELNPHLPELLTGLAAVASRLILRSNLTALAGRFEIAEICRKLGATMVVSLPAVNASQTDAQRGAGVLEQSIAVLKQLNGLGYGMEGSGLELDLVSNPAGAFLPPSQAQAEKKFKSDLLRKYSIEFNHLLTFANVPLGRYLNRLRETGNFDSYMERLRSGFNPRTVEDLMCRTLVSVSWDGYLYDCDFNQAAGLCMEGRKIHVSEMNSLPRSGLSVPVADHCYACTVGAGFT